MNKSIRIGTFLMFGAILLASVQPVLADNWWSRHRDGIRGSGDLKTEKRDVGNFTRIETSGSFDVDVIVGEEASLTVTFDDNLLEFVLTEVHAGTLYIDTEESFSSRRGCKVEITVPVLEAVESSGSGDISVRRVKGKEFKYTISGSGDVLLDGTVDQLEISIAGSGDVDARDLRSKEAYVKISGSGDVEVYASEYLDGRIYGSGDISYYGNPEDTNKKVYGSGSITRRR